MTKEQTRRAVLKTGAAVGSLAMVGSMAGCSSLLGGDTSADYTDWLYAPGAVGDQDHYFFTFVDDQTIRANEDSLGDDYNETEQVSDFPLDPMGVDYDTVDTRIGIGFFGSTQVVTGSFSESDVVDELEDNEFEEDDDYEGYTYYVREEESDFGGTQTLLVAVNESTAIGVQPSGSEGPEAQDIVEALVDTEAGEEDRYVDESDDMALLVDELGDATTAFGGTQEAVTEENASAESGSFVGQVAFGQASTIDGDTTERTFVNLFADADDIDTDAIEDWTDNSDEFEDLDNIEVSESGRAAIVTGEADTETLASDEEA